jgi:hypothetical protein
MVPGHDGLSAMALLIEVLSRAGFDPNIATKLVRHTDHAGHPVQLLRQGDELELYQSYQGLPKFRGAMQIVSFYGLPGTRAGSYGVYKVLGCQPVSEARPLQPSQIWMVGGSQFFYELERDPRFHDLRDRLIIDWGRGTRTWVKNLCDKPVLELAETA